MANMSSFQIIFNKPSDEDRAIIEKRFKEVHIDDAWYSYDDRNSFDLYDYEDRIDHKHENIDLVGEGRWHGPYDMVIELADLVSCDVSYHDAEPGCDYYHFYERVDGEVNEGDDFYTSLAHLNYNDGLAADMYDDLYNVYQDIVSAAVNESIAVDILSLSEEVILLAKFEERSVRELAIELASEMREKR